MKHGQNEAESGTLNHASTLGQYPGNDRAAGFRLSTFGGTPGSQRPPSRVPHAVEGAAIILRRPAPPQSRTPLKGKRRSLKHGRRISAGARVPRARAHPRQPRHGDPTVFTRCDHYFRNAVGRHVAYSHHQGEHQRRGWNAGTVFRSTFGAPARV